MTDETVGRLRRELRRVFVDARRVVVLANRGGMLVVVGHPTSAEIAAAAMLLASVNARLPSPAAYVAPGIPAARVLRLLVHTDRGSILTAPVLELRRPVGAVLIEGPRGRSFSKLDLARLEALVERCAPAVTLSS